MAKKVDFTPRHDDNLIDSMMTDLFSLLRAVVDGDEKAREQLRTMLDMFDKYGHIIPEELMSETNVDDESNEDIGAPLTLPRTHVRELHLRIKMNRTELKNLARNQGALKPYADRLGRGTAGCHGLDARAPVPIPQRGHIFC